VDHFANAVARLVESQLESCVTISRMTRSDFGPIIAGSAPERLSEVSRENRLTVFTGTVRLFMMPVTLPS